jgi:hypothetical protein
MTPRFRVANVFALFVALAPTVACTNAILFASSYQAGIEINALENGRQTARVAVSKTEGVTMPVCRDEARRWFARCNDVREKAYSTLSLAELKTGTLLLGGLTTTRVRQIFATGKAAQDVSAPALMAQTFLAMEYGADDATACLDTWAAGANRETLRQWLDAHGIDVTPTAFMYTSGFAAERMRAVRELEVPCPPAALAEPTE